MTQQKKGFWLFIFSLIPGAGEMYMGFKKQGLSIMLIFWSVIALASGTGMGWMIMFLPILWFYSFFNVHNLKCLSEEEFYAVEDSYILHLDDFLGDTSEIMKKYRTLVALLLIVFGISILWNNFTDILFWILPSNLSRMLSSISYQLPQIVIAIAIIIAGVYILFDKKNKLIDQSEEENSEHYWAPYRPYQQSNNPESESSDIQSEAPSAPAQALSDSSEVPSDTTETR